MKLSTGVFLFGAVIATIFHGTSAAAIVSPGGIFDEEEYLIVQNRINCATKLSCDYGYNTCKRINNRCNGLCVWEGDRNTGSCRRDIQRSCKRYSTGADCFSAGCVWRSGKCRNPSTVRCIDYDNTSRRTCVSKGCFWDRSTRTCNSINRSCKSFSNRNECRREGCLWRGGTCQDPSSNGVKTCTGPDDRSGNCDLLNEFCYTKGNCSANARGVCTVKPKTFSDCLSTGFSTFPSSEGNGCISNRYYNSECQAAIQGENVPRRIEDEWLE